MVAIAHRALRRLIVELLERDQTCWQLHAVTDRRDLAAIVSAAGPDLVVIDDGDLGWCREPIPTFAPERVIVVGPEPDPAYEQAARRAGAGAWLCRDRVGEDLIASMRRVLRCTHGPAPSPPAARFHALSHDAKD